MQCEALLTWPSDRVVNATARLPKEDGGARLVALVSTLARLRARVRQPLTRGWIAQRPHRSIFGLKRGASSVDSAFSHDIAAEVAHLVGQSSLAAAPGLHEAFDGVFPEALLCQGPSASR